MTQISRRTLLAAGAALAAPAIGRAAGPIKFGASLSLTGRFSDSA